jgi:hypothetical protein
MLRIASVKLSSEGGGYAARKGLVSTFVAYTDDFRQTDLLTGTVKGPGQTCSEPGASMTITATLWGYEPLFDFFNTSIHMSPNDRVRIGTTVLLHGPNYQTRVAASQDVRLAGVGEKRRGARSQVWAGLTTGAVISVMIGRRRKRPRKEFPDGTAV